VVAIHWEKKKFRLSSNRSQEEENNELSRKREKRTLQTPQKLVKRGIDSEERGQPTKEDLVQQKDDVGLQVPS